PGHDAVTACLAEAIDSAREDVGALLRPHLLTDPQRTKIRQAIADAMRRNVRIRLVVDYHPPELDFLSALLRQVPDVGSNLEIRFFAPQLARLLLIDRKSPVRCIHTATSTS